MTAIAAPKFVGPVVGWINLVLLGVSLVVEIGAFINCLTQKAEAFAVVGSIPKGGWLAIIGGTAVLSVLLGGFTGGLVPLGIFGLIALGASAFYLLDVRPGLRDAVGGSGW